jgi:thiol-disulfide isomerase/thioredoxin
MTKTNYLLRQFFKSSLVFAVILLTCASAVYAEANTYNRPTSAYVKNSLALKSVNYKTDKLQSSTINPIVHLLNQEYEFIFFYESGCGYCIAFAPILKRYAAAAGIQILAFVFAGANKATSLFSSSTVVDQSTVAQFFGQGTKISTPTLFIWNKRNGHVYPVASGMHTYEELDSRMNDLAPKILRKEAEFGEENKYV